MGNTAFWAIDDALEAIRRKLPTNDQVGPKAILDASPTDKVKLCLAILESIPSLLQDGMSTDLSISKALAEHNLRDFLKASV